jgi:hypothetical protein
MATPSLVSTNRSRITRDAPFEGFDFGDQVGDARPELAEDWTELFLPPAAQGFDGEPPAGGELIDLYEYALAVSVIAISLISFIMASVEL